MSGRELLEQIARVRAYVKAARRQLSGDEEDSGASAGAEG
jgi:hypothetical protein